VSGAAPLGMSTSCPSFDRFSGTPDHRRHLAKHYAEEIRIELGGVR